MLKQVQSLRYDELNSQKCFIDDTTRFYRKARSINRFVSFFWKSDGIYQPSQNDANQPYSIHRNDGLIKK